MNQSIGKLKADIQSYFSLTDEEQLTVDEAIQQWQNRIRAEAELHKQREVLSKKRDDLQKKLAKFEKEKKDITETEALGEMLLDTIEELGGMPAPASLKIMAYREEQLAKLIEEKGRGRKVINRRLLNTEITENDFERLFAAKLEDAKVKAGTVHFKEEDFVEIETKKLNGWLSELEKFGNTNAADFYTIKRFLEFLQSKNETPETTDKVAADFTAARQVLAIHFLLKECMINNPIDDPTPTARFVQFLTKRETGAARIQDTSLYKRVQKPMKLNDTELIKDLQYIRPFFENLGLARIVAQIEAEINRSRSK